LIALITISTRASLKKYHTYNLVLGQGERGDEWEFQRIGTEREKMAVERELQELRDKLAQVEAWKKRHQDIERELAKVWVAGSGEEETLAAPEYAETETEDTQDEAEYQEAQEEVEGDETETETNVEGKNWD
jgi:ATP-binding cassette subfamily D (ALD) long-chain fatty acid import protein